MFFILYQIIFLFSYLCGKNILHYKNGIYNTYGLHKFIYICNIGASCTKPEEKLTSNHDVNEEKEESMQCNPSTEAKKDIKNKSPKPAQIKDFGFYLFNMDELETRMKNNYVDPFSKKLLDFFLQGDLRSFSDIKKDNQDSKSEQSRKEVDKCQASLSKIEREEQFYSESNENVKKQKFEECKASSSKVECEEQLYSDFNENKTKNSRKKVDVCRASSSKYDRENSFLSESIRDRTKDTSFISELTVMDTTDEKSIPRIKKRLNDDIHCHENNTSKRIKILETESDPEEITMKAVNEDITKMTI